MADEGTAQVYCVVFFLAVLLVQVLNAMRLYFCFYSSLNLYRVFFRMLLLCDGVLNMACFSMRVDGTAV